MIIILIIMVMMIRMVDQRRWAVVANQKPTKLTNYFFFHLLENIQQNKIGGESDTFWQSFTASKPNFFHRKDAQGYDWVDSGMRETSVTIEPVGICEPCENNRPMKLGSRMIVEQIAVNALDPQWHCRSWQLSYRWWIGFGCQIEPNFLMSYLQSKGNLSKY